MENQPQNPEIRNDTENSPMLIWLLHSTRLNKSSRSALFTYDPFRGGQAIMSLSIYETLSSFLLSLEASKSSNKSIA